MTDAIWITLGLGFLGLIAFFFMFGHKDPREHTRSTADTNVGNWPDNAHRGGDGSSGGDGGGGGGGGDGGAS